MYMADPARMTIADLETEINITNGIIAATPSLQTDKKKKKNGGKCAGLRKKF